MLRIGVDIGGTKINLGLFQDTTLLGSERLATADVTSFPVAVAASVRRLLSGAGHRTEELISVGIGVPGTVSSDGRHILKLPNLPLLTSEFVPKLEEILGVPVLLTQDSRAAAYGEYAAGAGKGHRTVICVTLGTGIGTGIVIDGKIYAGACGGAGELGHLPVGGDEGRLCGCGKRGCLEKYVGGPGLAETAKGLFGANADSHTLFEKAKEGDLIAGKAISEAVLMLGKGLVSIVNLLSPDCLLFSGGLSEQEDLFLRPLISYLKSHCYTADGSLPVIGKASLGSLAPLYGAALFPENRSLPGKRMPKLSASVMCADALAYGNALKEIAEAGIDFLHCDIMDNAFVPNLMLPPELFGRFRTATSLPFDYHIMAYHPETVIERLPLTENDFVSIHAESTEHIERVISLIRAKGAHPAIAINPATPITAIEEILPEIDMVLIMTVNPGFAGQKLVPNALSKIRKMRTLLDENGYSHIPIEVDGNCSFENVPQMAKAGAEIFVVGSSSVFQKGQTIREGTEKLMSLLG